MEPLLERLQGRDHQCIFFPSAETSQRQAFAIKLSGFNRYQHQNHSTLKYKTFMYNYAYKKNVLCEEQFEANLTNSKNHSYLRFERKKNGNFQDLSLLHRAPVTLRTSICKGLR